MPRKIEDVIVSKGSIGYHFNPQSGELVAIELDDCEHVMRRQTGDREIRRVDDIGGHMFRVNQNGGSVIVERLPRRLRGV